MNAPSIIRALDRIDDARSLACALRLAILGADDVIDPQEAALSTLCDAIVDKLDLASAELRPADSKPTAE